MNRTNRVKSELSKDNVVCGCMLAEMRTPAVAMILESAGLDFFIIDMEHGLVHLPDRVRHHRGLSRLEHRPVCARAGHRS